ncbi:hypothetical protein CYLTODRAFT_441302 [Cylindrobasidium torrendii FP15055 ss-10]|uniref:Velvet domain-containing protein n=1 Tax=Cylindrobasidium torrendii FP15055 ss-10 TaxID=1314674 RepID=A0A0D7BLM3_9AGAR|nr:hypothetical protein CYLTODRAFT_441302 [Cylindrobasidium torrendii FP15055 ss-10]
MIENPVLHYTHGPFAGMTVRARLEVLQSAEKGRKISSLIHAHASGRMDVRTIDPPPVVQITFFEVNERTLEETEIVDYDAYQLDDGRTIVQALLYKVEGGSSGNSDKKIIYTEPRSGTPIRESDECTALYLYGDKFVSALQLRRWKGRDILVCPFGNLAVREEGIFVLHFIAFAVGTSGMQFPQSNILARSWSDTFEVFPSKQPFALRPSTDLTNRLTRQQALSEIASNIRKRTVPRKKRSIDRVEDEDDDMFEDEDE